MHKLTMLAPANVNHTHKWAHSLSERGYHVRLITQHEPDEAYAFSIEIVKLPHTGIKGYFLNVPKLQTILSAEDPGIIHAHYASGYGTLAALAIKQPYLLSVWGSDVYEFPYRSWLHKKWIQLSLKRAGKIASTSHAMAEQVRTLIGDVHVDITPFGVAMERFKSTQPPFSDNRITIGTAKKLDHRYGIDILIKSFADLYHGASPELQQQLQLRLVGDGPQRAELEALTQQLGISEQVTFVGVVPSYQVPAEINKIDIVVLSSRIESFGVSALEALAAKRPVIASNTGGLPEIIKHQTTGLLCEPENPNDFAGAMQQLIADKSFAMTLAQNGYDYVSSNFSARATTDTMCCTLKNFSDSLMQKDSIK